LVIASFSKRSLRSSSSARSLSSGAMTDKFRPVEADMALEQRQDTATDRSEADHDDRSGELRVEGIGCGHAVRAFTVVAPG